jgi:hypothetical protein
MGNSPVGLTRPWAQKVTKKTKKNEKKTPLKSKAKMMPKRCPKSSPRGLPNLTIWSKNGYKKRCKFALRFGRDSEAHSHQQLADNL